MLAAEMMKTFHGKVEVNVASTYKFSLHVDGQFAVCVATQKNTGRICRKSQEEEEEEEEWK